MPLNMLDGELKDLSNDCLQDSFWQDACAPGQDPDFVKAMTDEMLRRGLIARA